MDTNLQERVPGVTGETLSGYDVTKRMRTGGDEYSPAPYPTPYAPSYPAQSMPAAAPSWGPQRYHLIPLYH